MRGIGLLECWTKGSDPAHGDINEPLNAARSVETGVGRTLADDDALYVEEHQLTSNS